MVVLMVSNDPIEALKKNKPSSEVNCQSVLTLSWPIYMILQKQSFGISNPTATLLGFIMFHGKWLNKSNESVVQRDTP